MANMDSFFNPKSVAIVGASANPDKLGYVVLNNAITSGYKGKLYPINPKGGDILGLQHLRKCQQRWKTSARRASLPQS